jgi:hypothetical protein
MVTPAAKREASPAFCIRDERAAGVPSHRVCADDDAVSVAPAG